MTQMETNAPEVEEKEVVEEQEPQQSEQDIIKQLFKERDTYRQTNAEQRAAVNDIYNAYQGKMDAVKKVPYFEPVAIPKLRTEVSYIVPFVFSGNPEIEIEGVGEEDKVISQILEKIVNYRLSQSIPQAYEKIESWVKQAVTVGTSLIRPIWKFETKDNGDGTETPIVDEPDLIVDNILDAFYNPIVPEVNCQNSMIFRSVLPVDEVKNNPMYDFVGKDGEPNREKVGSGTMQSNAYDSTQQVSGSFDLTKASEGLVEVYERITKDRIQTVCDGKVRVVLRDKPWSYGFINAVKLVHEPNCVPNLFDGLGVGQNTLGIGKAYHSIVNQTKTNITLGNNPMFYGKKGARVDKKQLVSKPGGFIEVDGDGPLEQNFKQVQFDDIKQGALEFVHLLDDEHKRASGANDLVQGAASNKTLGQDQMASSYSSNRFELIQRRFKQALADVAEMLIKMEIENLQSVDAPILRIFPQELRPQIYQILINEAQSVKYNIKVKGDTTVAKNKEKMLSDFKEWLETFMEVLPPENKIAAGRKWLELRGIDGIDELMPDPQQYAQMMQQQQMGPAPMPEGMGQMPEGMPGMEQGQMMR